MRDETDRLRDNRGHTSIVRSSVMVNALKLGSGVALVALACATPPAATQPALPLDRI